MLSIIDQLTSIKPLVSPRLHAKREAAEERVLHVFDTLRGMGNVTINSLAEQTGIPRSTLKVYLQALMREGKIINWRLGNTVWYNIARPAPRKPS